MVQILIEITPKQGQTKPKLIAEITIVERSTFPVVERINC
jgi:hypothetical protein